MKAIKMIKDTMKFFNRNFIEENNLFLIGGATISLLNEEYRTSEDLDFYYNEDLNKLDLEKIKNNFLIENDIYEIDEVKEDSYTIKIFIQSKKENQKKLKIEFVKFEKEVKDLIERNNLFFEKYNNLKALNYENLLILKLGAFMNRGNSFPYKDFFDLIFISKKIKKEFKEIDFLPKYIKNATKNNSKYLGTLILNQIIFFLKNKNRFNEAKKFLNIENKIEEKEIMDFYIKYYNFEKETLKINRNENYDLEKLEMTLEEQNIILYAKQKRALGFTPTLNEQIEEDLEKIKKEESLKSENKIK